MEMKCMKTKRILSAALALLLVASLPVTAFAQEYDIVNGDITVSAEADGKQYVTQKNGVTNELQTSDTVIKHETNSTSTTNTVTINAEAGATAEVTLDGVNIDTSQTSEAAISTTGEGNVTIELDNTNTIKSGANHAGLEKNSSGELTITDTDNDGILNATGGNEGAGIGGGANGNGSDITIEGGEVTATGGIFAAGIGGGVNGNGSNITIEDSTVIANGGASGPVFGGGGGAGIGGGYKGSGSSITIEDSMVTATGGILAAGIGGGAYGNGSGITITGGEVTATGGTNGAGIGGGANSDGSNVTITDGEVTAIGGYCAAGIGGGVNGSGSDIQVWDDAQLKAQGGEGGGWTNIGAGAAVGNGGRQDTSDGYARAVDGEEVIDTSELTADGKIEYYAPGADMSTANPTRIVVGEHEHKWNNGEVTKEPTCTETGVMTYTCTAGNDFTKTEEIPATGNHNIVIDAAVAATCTSTGLTAGQHCTTCDTQTVEQEEVAKLEHYIVIDAAVEPTYTTTGLTEGSHCTTCDTMTVEQEIIPMLKRPDDTQSAPLYRVTDKDGKSIGYKTEQKDGVLTITVDADFAILTGQLWGINTLKSRGVERIEFITNSAISVFAPADLLKKGDRSETYHLTHDGETITFTLGAKMTDVSDILEKA